MIKIIFKIIAIFIGVSICMYMCAELFFSYNSYEIIMNDDIQNDYYDKKEYEKYTINGVLIWTEVQTENENEFSIKLNGSSKEAKDVTITELKMYETNSGNCLYENYEKKSLHTQLISEEDREFTDTQIYEDFVINKKYLFDGNKFRINVVVEAKDDTSESEPQVSEMEYVYHGVTIRYMFSKINYMLTEVTAQIQSTL